MKIASYTDTQTQIVGKRCDSCGRCVRLPDLEVPGARTAVSIGAELSRFMTIDIDYGDKLHRADLCDACSSRLLESVRKFLPAFREIAAEHLLSGLRTFSYRMLDAATDRTFNVSSLFDEGA